VENTDTTSFPSEWPKTLCRIMDGLISHHKGHGRDTCRCGGLYARRVRLFFKDGMTKDCYLGRSSGRIKVPLMLPLKHSSGGMEVFRDLVRVQSLPIKKGRILWDLELETVLLVHES